ncbi:hypothetical protein JEQ12_002158 [Ovis aries]|uniref:Uncharacterized protein n=1 Tax=Ovis aries TaxID=9940 RepID=A0A836CZZ6_SHEEP|nr:hypothetical protein JEQ12_002158 [Ovis aries]
MKIFFLLPSRSHKRGLQSSLPGQQKGCFPLSVHSSSDVGKHRCVWCLHSLQQGSPVSVSSPWVTPADQQPTGLLQEVGKMLWTFLGSVLLALISADVRYSLESALLLALVIPAS